eukprot:6023156-Pleurochrysis_carterae.AAC.1
MAREAGQKAQGKMVVTSKAIETQIWRPNGNMVTPSECFRREKNATSTKAREIVQVLHPQGQGHRWTILLLLWVSRKSQSKSTAARQYACACKGVADVRARVAVEPWEAAAAPLPPRGLEQIAVACLRARAERRQPAALSSDAGADTAAGRNVVDLRGRGPSRRVQGESNRWWSCHRAREHSRAATRDA